MSNSNSSLSLHILQAYYPVVSTLGEYLHKNVAFNKGHTNVGLVHETDSYAYRRLIDTCVVAVNSPPAQLMLVTPVMGHLHEILERAQTKLLTKCSAPNTITYGYRLDQRRQGDSGAGASMLRNYFVNTLITVLEGPDWNELYERVGTDVMFHLLTETSLFICLPNNCYCQLVGEPMINRAAPMVLHQPSKADGSMRVNSDRPLKRLTDSNDIKGRPTKRLKVSQITQSGPLQHNGRAFTQTAPLAATKSPADIIISRARVFFSRPNCAPHSEKITFGLPSEHVLNRLNALFSSPPSHDPAYDVRRQFERARHFAKYIFPRQYGLPHPFVSTSPDYRYNVTDADRELQIKALGSCKTPKRLQEALDLIEKMVWKHGKCAYQALLYKTCPSKLKTKEHESLDETIILEMLSESTQPVSQALRPNSSISTDSDGRSILKSGIHDAANQVKQKPRFAEFMCSYAEVFRFAVSVTKSVIPMAFWGSDRNFKVITNNIKSFIALRRYETLTLHSLLQGFCTSDCDWLMPHGDGARKQSRVSVTDSLKRLELVQDFVFWYFDGFLVPLLKTNFYITESGAFRNRVLYFRHDDWQTLCKPLVEKLCGDTFQKLSQTDAEEILRQRKLGFSFVRLLPKETGVRPIVNLRRKKTGTGQYQQSINQVLKAAFLILQYEKTSQSRLFGASVLGPNEIYTKLKGFKTRLSKEYSDGNFPKLYFVKLDVQACFDSIEQTKLLSILREIISEETYTIQRYGEIGVNTGQISRKFIKKALPAEDHPHFLLHATKLAESLRHVIFVDQVTYPSVQRQEILGLLEQHITDNIVKIGKDYYRQTVGIPQGSVLSTLLCSFFYGDLERRHLRFTDNPESVLLRLIDDYLFVTTSYQDAKRFLDTMKKGHPEYGCSISKDKTLTNFEDGTLGNIVDPRQKGFPWCGFMIDMQDLSVSKDYSRYHDTFLSDSLTVDRGRRPGAKFTQKMLQLSQFTSHIVFNDPGLNSMHTIHKNIYQNFVLVAMKMHHYIRSWRLDAKKRASFLLSTIHQMIRYTFSTMLNKAQGRVSRAVGGRCVVQRNAVEWLGTHAFHAVLLRKSHDYSEVVKCLEFELSLPRSRAMKRRFGKVTKESRDLFTLLSF